MMKSGEAVLVVDSVEDAVKFYTDKLAFDIADLMIVEGGNALSYASLRKGKCFISFRVPKPDEVVDFSQIKYAPMRGCGMFVVAKKGLEKYYNRCRSKGVTIIEQLHEQPWGYSTFVIKDPFGFKIMFGEMSSDYSEPRDQFCGIKLDLSKDVGSLSDDMIRHVRKFRLSQRASKKFAKAWLKRMKKAK
jgi:uncharacterized glyoxalase superfamily protein PhnB